MVLLDVAKHAENIKHLKAYHTTLKGFDKYLDEREAEKKAPKKSASKPASKKVRK